MVVVVLVPSSPSRRRTKPASVAYPQISLGEAEAEPDLQLPSPLLQVDEGRPLTPLFGTGPRPSSTVAPQALQPSSMAILEEISAKDAMGRRIIPGSSWMAPMPRVTRAASRKSTEIWL
ncbi:uncharacterized protein [Triticum aestivum]|uniref:uncharacterized protein isoform X4 n=1 Tax=Triticum aestivum TaxID=4565 RepID=UPI001D034916|nr:uncharacterized protein LOC123122565 isoform X4 [Triticum aestivum]